MIIDELKGRLAAKKNGVPITGALGVLLAAKRKELVPTVKPLLEEIRKTNFRLSKKLIEKALIIAGEDPDN